MNEPERKQAMQVEDGNAQAAEASLDQDEIDELERGSLIEAEPASTEEDVL